MKPTILVFDDHALVFDGIRLQIGDLYELHYAANGAQLLEKMANMQFAAVVVDLDFPEGENGFDYLAAIKATGAKVIVLTGTATDAKLRRCFHAGVDGLLEKHDGNADLRGALHVVLAGQEVFPATRIQRLLASESDRLPRMTERERDVLDVIFDDPGLSYKQIASRLGLSESRLARLVDQLADKFAAKGAVRIYLEATRRGYHRPGCVK
jgi:DNA-binding NarL/FixJ family response regulator